MRLIFASILLTSAVPANAQSPFDRLISEITSSKPSTQTNSLSQSFGAGIGPAQSATIDEILTQPMEDQQIAADRAEATPLIRTILTRGSCATAAEA